MGGVDKSDQMIKYYEVLRKSLKYWKKIFLHMIDLAVFNSYIMFTALQQEHPQDPLLKRKGQYTQKDFRCELMRGLAGIDVDEPVPRYCASTQRVVQVRPHVDYQHQQHIQTLQQQMHQQQIQHQQAIQTMQQQQHQQQIQHQQHIQQQQQMHQQQLQQLQQQHLLERQQIEQRIQLIQQQQQQQQQLLQQQQQQQQQQQNPRYSSHIPIVAERSVRCIVCSSAGRKNTKTRYRCQECNVPLCVSSADRHCFMTYHS
ncbi:putative cyclin-dependent serine/threonine-protein kinase DDB_G0272797/DDB_G0274007 [Corticium candelabrum]|uniref:putative cyclin-dependent serine/threonine-protein kinase DDB_G0272797/DDB_G0274007 n=1 Tax=Corticium candelabrum TaxID=121492 RepID=UPI002E252401|nr:putative cyclin-dependent serine/threonine-protein kinase DDB_G0272797/DDB_G0274007 [Corticium candelabrum]